MKVDFAEAMQFFRQAGEQGHVGALREAVGAAVLPFHDDD